jgi:hypothetical protein
MKPSRMMVAVLSSSVSLLFVLSSPFQTSLAATSSAPLNLKSLPAAPAVRKGTFYNWAGYAVYSSSPVTKAQGSWVQPSVICNSSATSDQAVVFWVGIDGFTSNTVEQTGTLAYCAQGSSTPIYYAWYEFFPAQDIIGVSSMTVRPGDVFKGTIIGKSNVNFRITLLDVTTGANFSRTNPTGFAGMRTSAECIAETPTGSNGYYLIPNFGTAQFGKDYTNARNTCSATINGKTQAFGNYGNNVYELTACNYPSCTVALMQPSVLSSDGTSFTVKWENSGP